VRSNQQPRGQQTAARGAGRGNDPHGAPFQCSENSSVSISACVAAL
jgi:hypothetical protein